MAQKSKLSHHFHEARKELRNISANAYTPELIMKLAMLLMQLSSGSKEDKEFVFDYLNKTQRIYDLHNKPFLLPKTEKNEEIKTEIFTKITTAIEKLNPAHQAKIFKTKNAAKILAKYIPDKKFQKIAANILKKTGFDIRSLATPKHKNKMPSAIPISPQLDLF